MTYRVIACALVLLLCGTASLADKIELISFKKLDGSSGDKQLSHDFSQEPDEMRVKLRCKLKRGSLTVKIVNPEGRTVWERSVEARSQLDIEETLTGSVGEWRVALDYTEAKGSYYLKVATN